MKRILTVLIAVTLSMGVIAQVPAKVHNEGKVQSGNSITFNSDLHDTLTSNDTISYVFQIEHTTDVGLIFDVRNKIIASDTSAAVTFWESMDNSQYYAVLAGATPGAYTKTIAEAAANTSWVATSDICWFGMRYLKVMIISKTKSGFKKIYYGTLKTIIK